MGRDERALTTLGRDVGELVTEPPTSAERAAGRARLLAALGDAVERDAQPAPRKIARSRMIGALVAATLAAVALLVLLRPRAPITFEVAAHVAGSVGDWIAAPASSEARLRFSDGSSARLAAGGRARVAAADPDGADIALERGALELAIVHRDHTRWRVHVGPFLVRVVGTRFDTGWDPTAERFTIALREGAVVVAGPVIGERAVRAGERITVDTRRGTLAVAALAAPQGDLPPVAPPEEGRVDGREAAGRMVDAPEATRGTVEEAPEAPSALATPPTHAAPSPHAPRPTWRALANDAKYKPALEAAERDGFGAICASGPGADVRLLADVARLGGDPARSREALMALRARFPGTNDASYAAFMLGRSAHGSHDVANAATWFERYLAEQPNGAFAEEALGRLVEIAEGGDAATARRAAQRYLARYPSGPHAAHARALAAP